MKKYLVEFIGTFFLVLTVGMTVIDPGAGALAPPAQRGGCRGGSGGMAVVSDVADASDG